jgi:hypothetical protein
VNLLLPQNRTGVLRAVTPVSIHDDRYVDLAVELDGESGPPAVGRLGAADCPEGLAPGDRVVVRFVMGVMTRATRETA